MQLITMKNHSSGNNYGSIIRVQNNHDDDEEQEPSALSSGQHSRMMPFFAAAGAILFVILVLASSSQSSSGPLLDLTASPSMTQREFEKAAELKPVTESSTPHFYDKQLVDHFDRHNKATWSQRYYVKKKHFRGPGHPIILEIGGEGANDKGFFYPFVDSVLAKKFGALVLHPEHRFYGISQPFAEDRNASVTELLNLLTPEQAMKDMLQIVQHYRLKLGCSMRKSSRHYCPLVTVGGSYPGFLAAVARLLYPEYVDIAYASSAPLKLYSKEASPWGYYEIITQAAERSSPGCSAAVKQTLTEVGDTIRSTPDFSHLAYDRLNVCPGSIPAYIDNSDLFAQELTQIVETSFADANMIGNYPPSDKTWFHKLCLVFQNETATDSMDKMTNFWKNLEIQDNSTDCFKVDYQMSEGDRATISSSDWSGLGPGRDGRMWDFQCCTSLTPEMGFSNASMFPYREWTYEWVSKHCIDRFGVVGDRYELVKKWHFDDLVGQGATRIIFTNGGNDMWMAGSYTKNLSDSIIAINIPSGGHHSEVYALPNDTPDVREAQQEIIALIGGWLHDIKKGKY